jgi:FkbH-like protein
MSEPVVPPGKPIKLVIWDLDDARWTGAAAEPPRAAIAALDERGILQSVIGRTPAPPGAPGWMARLEQLGVADYLLCPRPELGDAGDAAAAVRDIVHALNLHLDATLVVGDRAAGALCEAVPELRTIAPADVDRLVADPLIGPSLAGIEPRPRRLIYREEQARTAAQRAFRGSLQEFAATLAMRITLAPAAAADLPRLRELVNRSNQLGVTCSDSELEELCSAPERACLLVALEDRFGDCGKVGLAVVELGCAEWTLRLLQFSCRVLPRGVDAIVLGWILRQASAAGVALVTEVVPTSKNHAAIEAYQRAGFTEIERRGERRVLAHDLAGLPPAPSWVTVTYEPPRRPGEDRPHGAPARC